MKKIFLGLAAFVAVMTTSTASAEVTVSGGAALVSNYVWRGVDQGYGANFQPTIALSAGNFTLGGWGSTSLDGGMTEVDFSLAYGVGGFSAMVTNYWYPNNGTTYFGDDKAHVWEGTLAYTITEDFPLTIAANVMFAGKGDQDAAGDQNFTTYFSVDYPFTVATVDCNVGVGFTANGAGQYCPDKEGQDFGVTNIAFKASKSVVVTPTFELPLFTEVSVSPYTKAANIVFGLSLGF